MPRIEILTEEPSMKALLEGLLPRLLPAPWALNQNYFVRAHDGKSDLQRSIPRKMQVFSSYYERAGIIVLQDQDSHDCKRLKQQLLSLCQENGNCPVLVRIVCTELESWYLGDLQAVEKAYPSFRANLYANKAKYRNPDNVSNAAEEMKKILPGFQKGASARTIGPHLSTIPENSKSESFQQFITGILRFFKSFEEE